MVQIREPCIFDKALNDRIDDFARNNGFLSPRHVAYTIFPEGLYRDGTDAAHVFVSYNRKNGLYERLHKRKKDWGTYFRRMTHYEGKDGMCINQLKNIIEAFRNRNAVYKAAYTMLIQYPGRETVKPLGGPCLNYLTVQADPVPFTVGMMAVYRNHDFLRRAYGNYWGLCNLVAFIAKEIEAEIGPLNCVSSHAYIDSQKTALRSFVEDI